MTSLNHWWELKHEKLWRKYQTGCQTLIFLDQRFSGNHYLFPFKFTDFRFKAYHTKLNTHTKITNKKTLALWSWLQKQKANKKTGLTFKKWVWLQRGRKFLLSFQKLQWVGNIPNWELNENACDWWMKRVKIKLKIQLVLRNVMLQDAFFIYIPFHRLTCKLPVYFHEFPLISMKSFQLCNFEWVINVSLQQQHNVNFFLFRLVMRLIKNVMYSLM